MQGADGIKTGYTKKSGWGIAASTLRDNRRINIVINGTNSSRSRLNESAYLINWAFTQTSQKKLVSKGQIPLAVVGHNVVVQQTCRRSTNQTFGSCFQRI